MERFVGRSMPRTPRCEKVKSNLTAKKFAIAYVLMHLSIFQHPSHFFLLSLLPPRKKDINNFDAPELLFSSTTSIGALPTICILARNDFSKPPRTLDEHMFFEIFLRARLVHADAPGSRKAREDGTMHAVSIWTSTIGLQEHHDKEVEKNIRSAPTLLNPSRRYKEISRCCYGRGLEEHCDEEVGEDIQPSRLHR